MSLPAGMSLPALRHDMPALTEDQVALIKRTVAKGATDDELALFLHAAQRTGLDPLMKQIHAVKRWDKTAGREVMAIQTGIDGLRLVAERTGRYAPGPEPTYVYDGTATLKSANVTITTTPTSATAHVKKMTADGTWHVVSDTAHWSEFVQTTKEGRPTRFWAQMPHVMLAKCAEAKALRRAFPMELSGVYTWDEMGQAENDGGTITPAVDPPMPRRLSERPEAPPPDPVVTAEVVDPDEARIGAEVFGTYGEGRDPTDVLGDEEKHALKEYVLEHGLTDKQLAAYCRQLGVKKGALTVAQAKMIRQWAGAQ